MAGLLIRDLPNQLHRKLRERAQQNRRSMAKEALSLLERALAKEIVLPIPEQVQPLLPERFVGQFRLTDEWLEQAKRPLPNPPLQGGDCLVDIR